MKTELIRTQWDIRNLQATQIQSLKKHFYVRYVLIVPEPVCTHTYNIHKLSINQRCQAMSERTVCVKKVLAGSFAHSVCLTDWYVCVNKPDDHHRNKTRHSRNMTCISNSCQQAHALQTEEQWTTNPALFCLSELCFKSNCCIISNTTLIIKY